jgi:hypothetical protein
MIETTGHREAAAMSGYLGLPDACYVADVTTRTMMRWIAAGLPSVKVSGRRYVRAQDLEAWALARIRRMS